MQNDEGVDGQQSTIFAPGSLNVLAQRYGKFVEDFRCSSGNVVLLLRVVLKIVKLQRAERIVLHEFPLAADERLVILAPILTAAFTTHEVEIPRLRDAIAFQDRHEAHGIEIR